MSYIITSKTRRRSPHGKTVTMEHKETGEVRITDERGAEKKSRYPGWTDPVASPCQPKDR